MSAGRRAFRPRVLHMQRHGNLKAKGKEGTEPQLSSHHFRAHTERMTMLALVLSLVFNKLTELVDIFFMSNNI